MKIQGALFLLAIHACTSAEAFTSSPLRSLTSLKFQQIHHQNQPYTNTPISGNNVKGSTELNMLQTTAAVASRASGVLKLRGGFSTNFSSPTALFNHLLVVLFVTTAGFKLLQNPPKIFSSDKNKEVDPKSADVRSLQFRFLSVFWLLRCADWLMGPYFYEVYASKVFNGVSASLSLISKLFLTGFVSTAVFGPFVGRYADVKGRKKGTLAFTLLYTLGALSTKSSFLTVLLLGRVASGIGTSLLFSAPEAWMVGESQRLGIESSLGETFGLAYAGDSIVAILAGQMAGMAAAKSGPTAPFELSVFFLAAGALLSSFLWKENVSSSAVDADGKESKITIRDALKKTLDDKKIMLVGSVQALFEAAMYIFVLQWPPAMVKAIEATFGVGSKVPYGTIFSCFMASCLFGSTMFSQLTNRMKVRTESAASGMLLAAFLSMAVSTLATTSSTLLPTFAALVSGFFAFEACVGMYFPSIGTLRGKYVPDSHRSVIMNLFGIPLNVLVVSVFLGIKKLGVTGALSVSTGALGLATACMMTLRSMTSKSNSSE